ncbi:hypothetical protein WME94_16860 [Sorangium sp. So ce429]
MRSRIATAPQYIDLSTLPERTFLHLGAHAGLGDHNIVVSTSGDGLHHTGGNRDVTVRGDQAEDVTGDVVEDYAGSQRTHVSGAFTETIHAGARQTISAGARQSIDGGLKQTIQGGEQRTVNGAVSETIDGGRTQSIIGATVETIGGSVAQTVTGFIDVSTPATYVLNASSGITMMTPASGTLKGTGGVKLLAPGGQMTVDARLNAIGNKHWSHWALKASYGVLRMAFTGTWARRQGAHIAVYGLKVDIKALKSETIKKTEINIVKIDATGVKIHKSGSTQIK